MITGRDLGDEDDSMLKRSTPLKRSAFGTPRKEPRIPKARVKKPALNPRQKAAKQLKKSRKAAQDGAAWLWRQICYTRAGFCCEICGRSASPGAHADCLAAHHIVKRSQSKRLQLDYRNSMAVCGRCHLGADRDQVRCLAILEEIRPGYAEILLRERRRDDKVSFDAQVAELVAQAEALGIEIPESLSGVGA